MYSLLTPSLLFEMVSIDGIQKDYQSIPLKDRPGFFARSSFKNPENKVKKIENIKISILKKKEPRFIDIPYEIKYKTTSKTPDLIIKPEGFHYVSKAFKNFIEEVDPSTHFFWKVDVSNLNPGDSDIYIMQIGRVVSIAEISDENSCDKEERELKRILNIKNQRSRQIEDIAIFSTKNLMGTIFISNKIKEKMVEASFNTVWDVDSDKNESIGECLKNIS